MSKKIGEIKSLQPSRRRAKEIGKLSKKGRARAQTKAKVIQLTKKIEEANLLGKTAANLVREKRNLEGKIFDISEKIKAAAKGHDKILDFDFLSFVEKLASIAIPTRFLNKTRKERLVYRSSLPSHSSHLAAKVANGGSKVHTHSETFSDTPGQSIGYLGGAQKPSQFLILNPEAKPESNPLSLPTNTSLKINQEFESERDLDRLVFEGIFSRFAALPHTCKVNDCSKSNFLREFYRRQNQGKTSLELLLTTLAFWENDYYSQQTSDGQAHSLGRLFVDLAGIVAAKKRIILKNLDKNPNKIAAIHEFCEVRCFDVFEFSSWLWQEKAPQREDIQKFLDERACKQDSANDNSWEAYLRNEQSQVIPIPEQKIAGSGQKDQESIEEESAYESIEEDQEDPLQLGAIRLAPSLPRCDELKTKEELRAEIHNDKSIRAILMKIQLICVKRSIESKDDGWISRYKNEIEPGIKNYQDAMTAYADLTSGS